MKQCDKAPPAAAPAPKPTARTPAAAPKPSKCYQMISDSLLAINNTDHDELLCLIKTGGFEFGFPPGPETTEWLDTDPWCEFKLPVKASSPSGKILAFMKHYLDKTVPFRAPNSTPTTDKHQPLTPIAADATTPASTTVTNTSL